jgi:hypothetical protein
MAKNGVVTINKVINYISKNKFLVFLILLTLITRLTTVLPNIIPFGFDHGKDSIAILHMVKTFSLKFIGPWTSIPGLYFGPAWYYLLAPAYFLLGGNPLAGPLTMIVLNLLTIFLAYKYFGKLEAIFFATTPMFFLLSTSAWNPFPMPLIMLIILINLKAKKLTYKNIFLIAFFVSLGFHFSSAYSVFYLLTIPLIIAYKLFKSKQKINYKFVNFGIAGFIIPFIPQLLFEIKNNFIESKAILNYFKNPPIDQFKTPFSQVLNITLGEIKIAIFPDLYFDKLGLLSIFSVFILLLALFFTIKKKERIEYLPQLIAFIVIPITGFSFLHFNPWYAYAMLPVIIVFVSQLLKNLPKQILYFFILLLLITPISKTFNFIKNERSALKYCNEFLPIEARAIDKIYQLADNQAFSSYHYSPKLYDYAYQYIYLWRGFQGRQLPIEFSYKPNEIIYVREKPELLAKLPQNNQDPKYIFYIVEKADNPNFLESWWNSQNYKEIIYEEKIGPNLTLYQALAN